MKRTRLPHWALLVFFLGIGAFGAATTGLAYGLDDCVLKIRHLQTGWLVTCTGTCEDRTCVTVVYTAGEGSTTYCRCRDSSEVDWPPAQDCHGQFVRGGDPDPQLVCHVWSCPAEGCDEEELPPVGQSIEGPCICQ